MLVTLGAALFVLVSSEIGMGMEDLSRVIQGVATGIGFIGGGAILKLSIERQIQGLPTAAGIWMTKLMELGAMRLPLQGLPTAAGIWMTAAVGVAVGLGHLGVAILSVALTWIVLALVGRVEHWLARERGVRAEDADD